MMKKIRNILIIIICYFAIFSLNASNYPRSVFVPKQLTYNSVLENSITLCTLNNSEADDNHYCFTAKPIYLRTTGNKLKTYFNINRQATTSIQEDGSGQIDSLWLQTSSPASNSYASVLSFAPVRQVYGSMLYFYTKLPKKYALSINTALATARHDLHQKETLISNAGPTPYQTVLESLASPDREYGRIGGSLTTTGLDDIQVKLIKNVYHKRYANCELYALLGIPTNVGIKSVYLFEPSIGSRHAQLGLGATYVNNFMTNDNYQITFGSEIKWLYGLPATETRLFDLTANGEWSRYMLLTTDTDKYYTFFASNNLALPTRITPRSSLDIYLAFNIAYRNYQLEFGYDFWFRNSEKIKLSDRAELADNLGIADLLGIANLDPQTASTSNISQSVAAGSNQMVSDADFVNITLSDLNLTTGQAPQAISNTLYGAFNYNCVWRNHPLQIGINGAYEISGNFNTPSTVISWINVNFNF
jgi:hypothetical protein